MSDGKKYYSKFLKGHDGKVHLSCHSHYLWPDIAFSAYEDYWTLASQHSDAKWKSIFSKEIPKAQKHISQILNFSDPERIAFAPNTQELVARLLSCFYHLNELNILTTTSEFHSFSRQVKRLEEEKKVAVTYVDNEKENFEECFLEAIAPETKIIFLSQVFFNSGQVISLDFIKKIIKTKAKESILVIDGYHGFCAVKTDLSEVIEDIFYLAGSYKYAQAGEGMCFMTTPKNCELRPLNTGWFADFTSLESGSTEVNYDNSGFRFSSSTLDFSTLFKFNRIWDFFKNEGISHLDIVEHSKSLQTYFITNSSTEVNSFLLRQENIGLFLSYQFKSSEQAKHVHLELEKAGILTDRRERRVRLSFAFYNDLEDANRAIETFSKLISLSG